MTVHETSLASPFKPEGRLESSANGMGSACTTPSANEDRPMQEIELDLLDLTSVDQATNDHELPTAPILTRSAYITAGFAKSCTQYGVLGNTMSVHSNSEVEAPDDPRLYMNTNAPFSSVICGVQGSGKSHTVSVLLENMLISGYAQIGSLEKPLAGLVLHFGEGGASARPCEAAWIGRSDVPGVEAPPVKVFVAPSSLKTMRAVYSPLGSRVAVEPLLFSEEELDAQAFLTMMAVGSSDSAPLYVQIILSILRRLGENYTYQAFKAELDQQKKDFNPAQRSGLEQRMVLLKSFTGTGKKAKPSQPLSRFACGQLTIIDLSDPFIDAPSASGLFEIIVRLFVRADVKTGKVLVVDEAHKYLSNSKGLSGLSKTLCTLTREQRHLAMRVIISTQEPTVVPSVLLDLCTVTILHRFSSPSWWDHLTGHVSADFSGSDAFDRVVKLRTGQAIILAPSGLAMLRKSTEADGKQLTQFGRRYVVMKTRRRVTDDGGSSILVLS